MNHIINAIVYWWQIILPQTMVFQQQTRWRHAFTCTSGFCPYSPKDNIPTKPFDGSWKLTLDQHPRFHAAVHTIRMRSCMYLTTQDQYVGSFWCFPWHCGTWRIVGATVRSNVWTASGSYLDRLLIGWSRRPELDYRGGEISFSNQYFWSIHLAK